jgi:hypothetical protein
MSFYDVTIHKTKKGIHLTLIVGNKDENLESGQN